MIEFQKNDLASRKLGKIENQHHRSKITKIQALHKNQENKFMILLNTINNCQVTLYKFDSKPEPSPEWPLSSDS